MALRQGALAEAQECLRRLKAEFPSQDEQIGALRTRLHQRAQAARDTTARAALEQAAEHQGRGDLEAAVTVLEQLEVRGLSPEVGEDVFGAWSQACSRLAQSASFDQGTPGSPHQSQVRFAPAKGRGLILMRDPAVPHGLVVFSALGMGPGYPRDKIVSDRVIVERARGFRRAAPLATLDSGSQSYASWQSYVTSPVAPVSSGTETNTNTLEGSMAYAIRLAGSPHGQYLVAVEQRGSPSSRSQCLVVSDDPARARRWADPSAARRFWADRGLPTDVPFEIDLVPEVGAEVCDFCSAADPVWTYPAREFAVTVYAWGSGGGWASCARCADLIERGAWAALAERPSTPTRNCAPAWCAGPPPALWR